MQHVLMTALNKESYRYQMSMDRITNPCFIAREEHINRQNGQIYSSTHLPARKEHLNKQNGQIYSSTHRPQRVGFANQATQTSEASIRTNFDLLAVTVKDWNCTDNAANVLLTLNHPSGWLQSKMEVLGRNSKHKRSQISLLREAFQEEGYHTHILKGLNFDDLSKYANSLFLPMLICGPVSGTDFLHVVGICLKKWLRKTIVAC